MFVFVGEKQGLTWVDKDVCVVWFPVVGCGLKGRLTESTVFAGVALVALTSRFEVDHAAIAFP